nr:hypothetical protein [Tanacetum cinerariifolium]
MIPNPDKTTEKILKPLSKITKGNKKQYAADVRVMKYLRQAIPNDIYNSVDACKNANDMWERIKRLMFGSDVTNQNHDPLALLAHSNASLSLSHANPSYSPQPYYVTHPSLAADYEDEYQEDSQEDKLTTTMMLLARAITQKFSTHTNNRLRTSSTTRNQATFQDGRVDIQTKKYFREKMLLAMKDEASTDDNAASDPSYDSNAVSEKAIAAQPKMYDGEMLHTTSLEIDSPDSEKTLEDVEESRLKIRKNIVKLNEKLNALYETFVYQQEPSVEQTYVSIPSTSNDCSKTKDVTSDLSNP